MEMFQVLVGGMFSILGACTILFIAFRAYAIGTEVTEIKELLKDLKRMNALDHPVIAPTAQVPNGEWPSVLDPHYNAELPYGLKPSESQRLPVTTQRES